MEEQNTKIIEIGGVKVECDLRKAKQVETFKVGDPVKLLIKNDDYPHVGYGFIIGFAFFKSLSIITVVYTDEFRRIQFAHVTEKSKLFEIAPCSENEIDPDEFDTEKEIDNKIQHLETEIRELKVKKRALKKIFEKIFKDYKDK